mmetsp:Transcript_7605/g.22550  ORF Transcript_7605/g.22550 Transcript_7605/m.22550 type:complete len:224 (-) Transcript_7605:2087-2758(-)
MARTIAAVSRLAFPGAGVCDRIISAIAALDHAVYFLHPVDAAALGLPDYFEVIKQPMDLETVRAKLHECQYTSIDAFARDIYLVFDNATKYNLPGTHVHSCATILKRHFTQELGKISGGSGYLSALKSYSAPEINSLNAPLDLLSAEPEYFYFASPVDPVSLPDHTCTMTGPVDVGTIRAKASSGVYNRRKDLFITDVRLRLVNAHDSVPSLGVLTKQAVGRR